MDAHCYYKDQAEGCTGEADYIWSNLDINFGATGAEYSICVPCCARVRKHAEDHGYTRYKIKEFAA